jgi:hypothetical protein
MGAAVGPPHLLFLNHPLAHDLIDGQIAASSICMLVGWLISGAVPSDGRLEISPESRKCVGEGIDAFFPTAQRRESDVEIMLLKDRDGRALG